MKVEVEGKREVGVQVQVEEMQQTAVWQQQHAVAPALHLTAWVCLEDLNTWC